MTKRQALTIAHNAQRLAAELNAGNPFLDRDALTAEWEAAYLSGHLNTHMSQRVHLALDNV